MVSRGQLAYSQGRYDSSEEFGIKSQQLFPCDTLCEVSAVMSSFSSDQRQAFRPLRKWIRAKKGELTKKRDSQLGFVYPSLESMPPGMALQMRQTFDYASIHSQPLPPQHPAPRPVQNPESLLPFESWIQQQQQQQQVVTEEDARGRKRVRIRQIPAWNNFRFDYKNIMKHLS